VLEFLKRYGWNATSFQCLEAGMSYWFDDRVDACVAYRDTGSAWVVAGAPITAPEHLRTVALRFVEAARAARRRVCFFAVAHRFTIAVPLTAIRIGEQPVWDPSTWAETVSRARSLREQLRRARAKGVTVRLLRPEEIADPNSRTRHAVEDLIQQWLSSRPMAPMGFLVQLDPFTFPDERRFLVAEREGRCIGFLAMVPVYQRDGWLLEDLLREPSAPNGTGELLIDTAMRTVAAEGSCFATLGLAPLSGRLPRWLQVARALGSSFYNFEGLRAFKNKLRPRRWERIYLCYPPDHHAAPVFYDVLSAFAPRGLFRFGIETLLHAPGLPMRILALLLIPWTALLALVPSERWFPAPWIQFGWVAFDIYLIFALLSLSRQWRAGLATLLAALISTDALLTALEVLFYNLPRSHAPLDEVVSLIAVLGPTLAATFLWATRSRPGRG
jgi:phosphatidylglycerol lysyltransferase